MKGQSATVPSGPLVFLIVALGYLALAQYVIFLNDPVFLGASFWPAAGLALGALLLLPTRRWPWVIAAIAVAGLSGDLAHGYPLAATLWWTAGNCLEPLLGAALIRRFGSPCGSLVPVRNLMVFLGYGVVVAPLIGASVGTVGSVTSIGNPFWQVWPKYVVGDALGVLVIAPMLLTWREPHIRRRPIEAVLLIIGLALVTVFAFRNWPHEWDVILPYLIVPFMSWTALRFGIKGVAWALLLTANAANFATATGYGPFAIVDEPTGHAITLLQIFLGITASTALLLATLVSDMIDRKQAEEALRASEERFREVATVTTDAIWDWNPVTDALWWSDSMYTLFGYHPSDFEANLATWKERVHPDDRDRVVTGLEQTLTGDTTVWKAEYRYRRKDGSYADIVDRGVVIRDPGSQAVRLVGGARDVSEQKTREAVLRQQAELLDKARDAIIVRGMDHRVRLWNHSAERLYGWSREEAIGRSVEELCHDDPAEFRAAHAGVLEQDEWIGPITQRRKEGSTLTVESHWTLVRDERGQPDSILVINTDITQRLALEEQLRQAQRLEAVGQLTGGVAHDFNNLLMVIIGNAELLTEELQDRQQLRPLAETISTAAYRGADLIRQMLAFARRQALEPQAVDVDQRISGMETMLRRTLTENIVIERTQESRLWRALIDPVQLESTLLNLVINARDAMPGGGRLRIETSNVRLDRNHPDYHPEITPGPYIMITVSDTGTGIAPEHLNRVFDPFFTTKTVGKGSGLGLSMVYGFIKQSSGHVAIDSTPGQGTTIRIYLPRAPIEPATLPPQPCSSVIREGNEKILLVEDDDLVRGHVSAQLASLGYQVVTARNGPEALDLLLLGQGPDFDLLFTDVIMPGGLNGLELAETARRLRPNIPVLFTSGYTEDVLADQNRPDVHLLQKPYRRQDLARALRRVLDGSR